MSVYSRKFAQNNAHKATHKAIKQGELIKGPCEICGTTNNVNGHHDNYTKPLEIRWLCVRHHMALHARMQRERAERRKMAHQLDRQRAYGTGDPGKPEELVELRQKIRRWWKNSNEED